MLRALILAAAAAAAVNVAAAAVNVAASAANRYEQSYITAPDALLQ